MRAAIISDVHGNLPALQAVLSAIEHDDVSEIWCVGDLVGYNAHPEACTRAVLELAEICLAGNHDLVVNGRLDMSVFAHDAAAAAVWSRQVLTEEALDMLRQLSPSGERAGVALYHGSPRDPVWEYVLDARTAEQCLAVQGADLALIGHSHVPLAYTQGPGDRALGGYAEPGTVELGDGRWLVNPGSVGQPRDGDPRAAYLLLDLDRGAATWRRVPYDIAAAQQAILEAGLPPSLAARLGEGR
ncbi:MAG: hypothetical protein QOJ13_826 [Gaiellales bacterium]|nr:hypothetical protein [Gaiellales bacterium]